MLTIVIVSFNSAAVLQKCQHELLSSGRFPVIIVDNASYDGSADTIKLQGGSGYAFNTAVITGVERLRYGAAAPRWGTRPELRTAGTTWRAARSERCWRVSRSC